MGLKHINFWIDEVLYFEWVQNKAITNVTQYLRDMIASDADLSEDQKDRLKIQEEIKTESEKLYNLQVKLATLKAKMARLEKEEDEEELNRKLEKTALMKAMAIYNAEQGRD